MKENSKTLAKGTAALGVLGAIIGVVGGIGGPFYFLGGMQAKQTAIEFRVTNVEKFADYERCISFMEGVVAAGGVKRRDPDAPVKVPVSENKPSGQ